MNDPAMAFQKVSFIVPALNEERFIQSCMDSIRDQMRDGDQLLVVDNGSEDGTRRIVEESESAALYVVRDTTVAALRNYGADKSDGDILAFVDADCTLSSGWREAVTEILTDDSIGAVGAPVTIPVDSSWIPRIWWTVRSIHESDTDHLVSANMAVRRDAFVKVGGFDKSLTTDEDTDLCIRIKKAGYRIVESPRVGATHHDNPSTLADFYKKERWHATSILGAARKQGVDRPLIMTWLFIATGVISIGTLAMAVLEAPIYLPGVLAIVIGPVLTALFRITQGAPLQHFPQLVILYLIFYVVRSIAMMSGLLRLLSKSEANTE